MASGQNGYQRLPGRSWLTLAGRHSIWLSSDHLLSVWNHYVTEDYKRFYFRDVQAIWLRETSRRTVFAVISGGLSALFLLFMWTMGWRALVVFPALPAGLFLTLFLINWARGPTCECRLQTAVQTENLVCLRRLRTAQKVSRILRGRIEAVQGSVAPEDLQARAASVADGGARAPGSSGDSARQPWPLPEP